MLTVAGWPMRTPTTSVSSTSISASISERSAIVMSTVPGLFMVPVITFSPSSMFITVMSPASGARKVT